jgi:hypothetical protein
MRVVLVTVILSCLLLFETPCRAQTVKPQSETLNVQSQTRTSDTCTFQNAKNQIDDYPNCVFADRLGNLFVAEKYVKKLKFNSYGLAAVFDDDPARPQFMYVDRKGRAIIQGITIYDSWAAEFSDGLVTISVDKKYGYADPKGKIVIAAQYDGVWPFEHGHAVVCVGCRETCIVPSGGGVDPDCEHRTITGGDWFKIDKAGRAVASVPAP